MIVITEKIQCLSSYQRAGSERKSSQGWFPGLERMSPIERRYEADEASMSA
jgi:hypothetical protein